MKIYLIRHGQTEWNAQSKVMGREDIPLDIIGEEQIQALANAISHFPFDLILSSPQLRAQQTAQAIAIKKELPVQSDERLSEVDFPRWQGKTHDEIIKDDVYLTRKKDYFKFQHEGFESFESLMTRIGSLVKDLEKKNQDVVLVSHADVVRALIVHLLGSAPESIFQFRIQNASCTVLAKEGNSWVMEMMNFTPTPLSGLRI